MIRTRGKRKGARLTPRQYANDWISYDTVDGHGVVNPGSVRLEPHEFALFADTDPDRVGDFWKQWRLDADGKFRANKPKIARGDGDG